MRIHTKVYMDYFKYDISDHIPCEICLAPAVDIHHIEARGMGGTTTKDHISNLMALCRSCHIKYGDLKHYKNYLKSIHLLKITQVK